MSGVLIVCIENDAAILDGMRTLLTGWDAEVIAVADPDAAIEAMTSEIQAAVKDRKGSVQSPKRIEIVDALPLTGLGKPDKKAVRARFWEGAGRAVG